MPFGYNLLHLSVSVTRVPIRLYDCLHRVSLRLPPSLSLSLCLYTCLFRACTLAMTTGLQPLMSLSPTCCLLHSSNSGRIQYIPKYMPAFLNTYLHVFVDARILANCNLFDLSPLPFRVHLAPAILVDPTPRKTSGHTPHSQLPTPNPEPFNHSSNYRHQA